MNRKAVEEQMRSTANYMRVESIAAASLRYFHAVFRVPRASLDDADAVELRKTLLFEEITEACDALDEGDLVGVAKELADSLVVIYGAAHVLGIPLDVVFELVHRSNMSKLDSRGEPIYRSDGKILKSDNYVAPEPFIAAVLRKAGHDIPEAGCARAAT
jgi:predicted HAD superfamily Cof-like phosphohydrolase